MYVSTSSGRIELNITKEQAASTFLPGQDCQGEVEAVMKSPALARQLKKLDPALVADELREYGAWDDEELKDHDQNLVRLVWVLCGDINDK